MDRPLFFYWWKKRKSVKSPPSEAINKRPIRVGGLIYWPHLRLAILIDDGSASSYGSRLRGCRRELSSSDWLGYLGRVAPPQKILLANGLFDSVDLHLISASVRTNVRERNECRWWCKDNRSVNDRSWLTFSCPSWLLLWLPWGPVRVLWLCPWWLSISSQALAVRTSSQHCHGRAVANTNTNSIQLVLWKKPLNLRHQVICLSKQLELCASSGMFNAHFAQKDEPNLFVDFGELVEVVLKEGDLLLLGLVAQSLVFVILRLQLGLF